MKGKGGKGGGSTYVWRKEGKFLLFSARLCAGDGEEERKKGKMSFSLIQ